MFRNAFAAPGLLHIVHNMRASMHTVYPDWEVFWNRARTWRQSLPSNAAASV